MDNFNFKEELEDQKKEMVEQYGEQIASYHWNGEITTMVNIVCHHPTADQQH